jgi:hypothetical protein
MLFCFCIDVKMRYKMIHEEAEWPSFMITHEFDKKKCLFFASKKMDVSNSRQKRCRNEELFIVYRSVDNIYEKEQNDKVMSFIDLWLYPQIYNENFSCLLSYFNIYISMTHHINMHVGWIHKYPFSLGRHGSLQLFNFLFLFSWVFALSFFLLYW